MKVLRKSLRPLVKLLRISPMHRVLRMLESRGVNLAELSALEVFGSTGEFHTQYYADRIKSLEIWEIDPAHRDTLRQRFPHANIVIGDSYSLIKESRSKYDLIVVDNPQSHHGPHCEHFDLFPTIFDIASDDAAVIVNVIPMANHKVLRRYPYMFDEQQLNERRAFYGSDTPADIPLQTISNTFKLLARDRNFDVEWHFFQRRTFIDYLVMKLRRFGSATMKGVSPAGPRTPLSR